MNPCSSMRRSACAALRIGLAATAKLLRQPVGLRRVEVQRRYGGVVRPQQHEPAPPGGTELKLEPGGERRSGRGDEWIVGLHCPSSYAPGAGPTPTAEPRDA